MASPPMLAEEADVGMDYVKIYQTLVDFKDTLAKIFLEKGLVTESCQLADFKTVTMETKSGVTHQVQQLYAEVMHVFKLISDVVYAVVITRVKAHRAATCETSSQTDSVSASTTKSSPPIKQEQNIKNKTEDDDDDDDDIDNNDNHHNSADFPDDTNAPTISATTSSTTMTQPCLRRSSRSSVLNRKPLTTPKPKTRTKNEKSAVRVPASNSPVKKTLAKNNKEEAEETPQKEEGGKSTGGTAVAGADLYERTPEGLFCCKECGKVAKLQTNIRKHLRKHAGEKVYQCTQCPKKFIYPQDLSRHRKAHTSNAHPHKQVRRKPAGGTSAQNSDLEDSLAVGATSGAESGKHSLKRTASQSSDSESNNMASMEVEESEIVKKEDRDLKHDQEGQRSLGSGDLGPMGSMYEVTEAGIYRCTVCGQETKDRSNMRKHVLRWHAGEQRYQCPTCSKAFTYQESLKFHMKVHVDPASRAFERTPQGTYRCKQCERECRNRSNIVKHVNRKHLRAGEKPYRCSLCPAVFGYPRSLKRHELVHEGVRPYKCAQCDKCFFDPTSLRTHARVHTNDRPFVCQLCGNRFRQKEGLKGHMRSHSGDKPYVCERCGMAFAAKRSLTRHIRVHTGERPYPCDQCVAAFADWTTLHNHKLVHRDATADNDDANNAQTNNPDGQDTGSENKPYQCQFCGIRYRQPLTLKRHLRIHAASSSANKSSKKKRMVFDGSDQVESPALHLQYRPYACEVCGERFKHLRGYNTHKTKHLNGTLVAKKPASVKRLKPGMVGEFGHQNQNIEPMSEILASVEVNSSTMPHGNLNMPMSVFQPPQPPPLQPPNITTIIDASALNGFSAVGSSLSESEAPNLNRGTGEDLIHYTSDNVTQVIQYEDGSLGHMTTLVPHHPPPLPPSSSSSSSASAAMLQPVEDLLENVVTVVFESGDGSVVLDSR